MKEITEEQFRSLKQEAERAKANSDRAAGALEQLMSQLESEYGCKDLESAQKKLTALQKEKDTALTAFNSALADYEKKWNQREDNDD